MDQRISLITLGVADLARAQAFYESLGWVRSVRAAQGVAFFQTGGFAFGLYPRDELADDARVDPAGSGFRAFSLAQNAHSRAEVDAVLAEAAAKGATLVKPAEDVAWGGYSGYFADPDGFLWEVAWNPGFALNADGSLTLPD
ncbi:MAG: VOC family protein [Alphaproteobacteria bacterium]